MQPFVEWHIGSGSLLIVQPTTSALVFLLAVVAVGAGLHFLRIRGSHRSRSWWGIALVLWGDGAFLAGVSYEAFSYQIKCAGRDVCAWTSWWEIGFLILTAASIHAILVAQAHSCCAGKQRRILCRIAGVTFAAYVVTVLIGALVPVRLLISFEWMLAVSAPVVLICVLLNVRGYARSRRPTDLLLLKAWGWLILTVAAYFLYLVSGLTQALWARGFWFSENDVLHVGLILWMMYLALAVSRTVVDEPEEGVAS